MDNLTSRKVILDFIKSIRKKRILLHAFYSSSNALLAALALFLINTILKKFTPIRIPLNNTIYLIFFVMTFSGFFLYRIKKLSNLAGNALYIDNRFSLKDMFSSYLFCSSTGIDADILSFQEGLLTAQILPRIKGSKFVDVKIHNSTKYMIACIILILLIYFSPTIKRRGGGFITQDEMVILKNQSENLNDFMAYIKKNSNEQSDQPSKEMKEFAAIAEEALEKLKDKNIDKREALKLLSKLVDSTKSLLKDKNYDMSNTEAVSEFDVNKLNVDDSFKESFSSDQEKLKENIKKLNDNKSPQEDYEELRDTKKTLDKMTDDTEQMMQDQEGQKQKTEADDDAEDFEMSNEDGKSLVEALKKAQDELKKQNDELSMQKKAKELTEELKDGQDKLTRKQDGDNSGEKSDSEYKMKEIEDLITFDSTIKKLEKGTGSANIGPGTTDEDIGYSFFDPAAPQDGSAVHDMTAAEHKKLYNPSRTEVDKEILLVKGALDKGKSISISTTKALPKNSLVTTPYNEIYGEYRDIAQKAINIQKVPKVYKDYILNYFDAINPESESKKEK